MTRLFTFLGFTVSGFLMAQADGGSGDIVSIIERIGGLGLAAIIVIYVIPKITADFTATIREIHATNHADSERLNETLRSLQANCAAVRAIKGE